MKAAIVVANSSPFITLERIGRQELLPSLFGHLWIPPAVRHEVFGDKPLPGWVKERRLQQPLASQIASVRLGAGEREAIALALELGATELILDDLPARRLARSLKVPVIGTLGLLLRAKQRELIPAVQPLMRELQDHDFRISNKLVANILITAREK
ncbi:MAG: DUF3368 domain-containing protein [Chloroflexi bacterium]|nr:DUF3368 domain-containing protein [Chloroflexota bacterium]